MKNLFLISFFLLFTFSCFGQLEKFDLSKQILADYDFKSLLVGFNSSGESQIGTFKNQSQNSSLSDYVIRPFISVGYREIHNSRSSQFSMGNSISFDGSFVKNSEEGSKSRSFSFGTSHSISKLFYQKKNWFYGISGSVGYGFSDNVVESSVTTFESNSNLISLSATPSIGIGRIENVTDAWRAYRMLEDLKKWGLLNREPTLEELKLLTELHTQRQRIRFFDSRFKLIEDIQSIANLLLENGLAKDGGGKLFTSLYDRWLYGVNATRTTGRRWQLSFPMSISRRVVKANTTDFEQRTGSFQSRLEYLNQKPLNLKWQFNWGASVTGSYFGNDLKDDNDDLYSLRPTANAGFGYYPNTRTSVTFGSSITYFINDWDQFEYLGENIERATFNLNTRFFYYFSPQTRLDASFSFIDNFSPRDYRCQSDLSRLSFFPGTNFEDAHCMRLSYSLRFSHAFF